MLIPVSSPRRSGGIRSMKSGPLTIMSRVPDHGPHEQHDVEAGQVRTTYAVAR